MMRIIAGEYRGRPVKAPKGLTTRPTTDRVRESLMSAIGSALGGFENLRVYDVFAGSGALGLECLSRGAAFALFTDSDAAAVACVKANLATFGVEPSRARVLSADVFKRLPAVGGSFHLVLLDPPYAYDAESIGQLVASLDAAGRIADGALVTYEHAADADISAFSSALGATFTHRGTKIYGDTAIEFFGKAES